MKKIIVAFILIIAFLAIFIPLASINPDGLEKVVQTFGAKEQKPIWEGLMTDYSVSFISNSYLSTLLTGIVGTTIVFFSALILSKTISSKKRKRC
jgi:ABC-type Fe3+ transport system permease subunit